MAFITEQAHILECLVAKSGIVQMMQLIGDVTSPASAFATIAGDFFAVSFEQPPSGGREHSFIFFPPRL
jgi:hypothetical protein